MNPRKGIGFFVGLLGAMTVAGSVWAGSIYVNSPNGYVRSNPYRTNPYYYADPYYGSNVVIVQQPAAPLVIPRYGSNDALYTYDNIYGPGASAAGRLSHSVHNPQPFYNVYYPR